MAFRVATDWLSLVVDRPPRVPDLAQNALVDNAITFVHISMSPLANGEPAEFPTH